MDLRKIREKLNLGIPLTELNLRVTYYSRVSTDHSLQINSLKNQNDFFDSMIEKNENWIYVKPYIDEGISGTSDVKRDNFMRMLKDAKNGIYLSATISNDKVSFLFWRSNKFVPKFPSLFRI